MHLLDMPNGLLGGLVLTSPFISIILITTGVVGYKSRININKAIIGITFGAVLLFISIALYIQIFLWFEDGQIYLD